MRGKSGPELLQEAAEDTGEDRESKMKIGGGSLRDFYKWMCSQFIESNLVDQPHGARACSSVNARYIHWTVPCCEVGRLRSTIVH